MATVKYDKTCDLCSQPVEIKGFSLDAEKSRLEFCCAGCQSIYQLLYAKHQLTDSENKKTTNNQDD